MKSVLLTAPALLLAASLSLAQTQSQAPPPAQEPAQPQVMGRGRGGAPFAWNDRNKDGICDITGRPVGEGRPIGFGRGRGMGRGHCGAGWGGRAARWSAMPPAQAAPSQPNK